MNFKHADFHSIVQHTLANVVIVTRQSKRDCFLQFDHEFDFRSKKSSLQHFDLNDLTWTGNMFEKVHEELDLWRWYPEAPSAIHLPPIWRKGGPLFHESAEMLFEE